MAAAPALPLRVALFRPGMRIAVAVSGGADSVALLRALLDARQPLGLTLSVVHVHHGLRGAEADTDAAFVAELATRYNLPLHLYRVDTPAAVRTNRQTTEQAARDLRYGCFRSLLGLGQTDAVTTAHTLDDQAETAMYKFIRGAWTEGLGGIYPCVREGGSVILRPILGVRRAEVEAYLTALDQPWRSDSSNLDSAFTRNRIRHELMPLLRTYNPQVDSQLARMSAIARDEEDYWQAELARLLPSILLPGKPVRGGGRATGTNPGSTVIAIEIERLRPLAPALLRRIFRAAAALFNHSLSFDQTEALLAMCGCGSEIRASEIRSGALNKPSATGRRLELGGELRVERTPRELRFTRSASALAPPSEYSLPIPGEVIAHEYGLLFRASTHGLEAADQTSATAMVRACRPGDRVTLRHSTGRKTVKEVLERLHLSSAERARWPLVEWQGEVIWLRGVEVDSPAAVAAGITLAGEEIAAGDSK